MTIQPGNNSWVTLPDHSTGLFVACDGRFAEVHLVDAEGFTRDVVYIDKTSLKMARAEDIPAVRRSSPIGAKAHGLFAVRPKIGMWIRLCHAGLVGRIVGLEVGGSGSLDGLIKVRLADSSGNDGDEVLVDPQAFTQAVYRDIPAGRRPPVDKAAQMGYA